MKYIDENKIYNLLEKNNEAVDKGRITAILDKAKSLSRLSIEETAYLLRVNDEENLGKIFNAASNVKNEIYGKRVVLFAPLYTSNLCSNNCLYCAFRSDNKSVLRKALTLEDINKQVIWLLKEGHKRVLMVAGETGSKNRIDDYLKAIRTIYDTKYLKHKIKRINVNVAPLETFEFKELKSAGIGTYQLFQETYHEKTYTHCHPSGPKSDPDNRIMALDRAFDAGIDDVGIGVLYGLYDYRFETLAMLMHIEALENNYNIGPHTISVPRIEKAYGVDFKTSYKMADNDFKKLVAILRLAVPYTGLILSTRERADLRDDLLDLGISQVSAGSETSPGGYVEKNDSNKEAQFNIQDKRSLKEVIDSILDHGYLPSFCAACYRACRTGETFMDLARPGTIKGKCDMNAMLTLKEYLDDFVQNCKMKDKGNKLIEAKRKALSNDDRKLLEELFGNIDKGTRDEFV